MTYCRFPRSQSRRKNRSHQLLIGQQAVTIERLEARELLTTLDAFLTSEHVDINVGYAGGDWTAGPRDSDNIVQYGADQGLMYVGAPALTTRAASSDFNFIGVGAGDTFYRLPQSQDPNLLYLGMAAYGASPASQFDRYNPSVESKGRVSGVGRWIKVSLVDVDHYNPDGTAGAGQFSVWQSGDLAPVVFMSSMNDGVSNPNSNGLDTTDGIAADDALWVVAGGHLHYNWGFTEPGRYEVTVRVSGYLGDDGLNTANSAGYSEGTLQTLYFSVGSVGQLEFDASSYTVNEDAGTATINVIRTGGSDGRITVSYATSDGTALAGVDYTATSGTLTFEDGETVQTITVPILSDLLAEGDESLNLSLSSPGPASIEDYYRDPDRDDDPNGLLGTIASAMLTIREADLPPTLDGLADIATDEDTAVDVDFEVDDVPTPAADLVVSADSSNTDLVPLHQLILSGTGANRRLTITPAANLSGSTTITVRVTDGTGQVTEQSFVLTVNPVNDAPVAGDDTYDVSEDGELVVAAPGVLTNDSDIEGSVLVAMLVTAPQHGTVSLSADGAFVYTPAADFSGVDSFTYRSRDGEVTSELATVTLNVGGANDLPSISNVADVSINEDGVAGPLDFVIGDQETAADDLQVSVESSNPSLVPLSNILITGTGANRAVTVTPATNASGSATITVTVTDADGGTVSDTFTVTVTAVNDLPVISPIGDVVMNEDGDVTINFTVGDVETAAGSLVVSGTRTNTGLFSSIGTSSSSRLQLGGSGANRTLRIRPNLNQNGSSSVTLTVRDASHATSTVTFQITVDPVNDPPRAVADSIYLMPGQPTVVSHLLANDQAPDAGQTLALQSWTQPEHGSITMNEAGQLVYLPDTDYMGFDSFSYMIEDQDGETSTASVAVAVGVVDLVHTDLSFNYVGGEWYSNIKAEVPPGGSQSPTIVDSDEAILYANPSTELTLPVLPPAFNFMGAGAGDTVWILSQTLQAGELYLGFSNEGTAAPDPVGSVRIDLASFSGPGHFSLYETGSFGDPEVAIDTLDGINAANDAAVGNNSGDYFTLTGRGHAHANWVFTQPGRYVIGLRPSAVVNTTDALGNPIQTTVTGPVAYYHFDVGMLTGLPLAENPPLARPDTATVAEDGSAVINVLANDTSAPDPSEALTVIAVTQGTFGTVEIGANGQAVTYTPQPDFSGVDTFTYTMADEHGGQATTTVTVTVAPQNDGPTALDDAFVVSAGNTVFGNVLFNDVDPDGDGLAAVILSNPTHGAVTLQANGAFAYVPDASFAGVDSFTYEITDSEGQTAVATVTLTAAGFQDFQAVLTSGHADIGVNYEDGEWDLHVHHHDTDEEYEPDQALYYVSAAALTTRPAGPEFDFLGIAEGASYYRLMQTENPEVLYLGLATKEMEPGTFAGGAMQMFLRSVNGPGQLSVWDSTDAGPRVLFSTTDGITASDVTPLLEAEHAHFNWGFTEPGRYEVTLEVVGTLVGESTPISSTATYYFSVDSLGQVSLEASSEGLAEGESRTITVRRTGGADGPLSMDYAVTGGSAVAGVDFAAFEGVVTFADGETEKTFVLQTTNDNAVEGDETVVIGLSASDNDAFVIGESPITVTIVDDDIPLQIEEVIVNSGAGQRSNLESIAVQFNRETSLSDLIALGSIGEAVKVVSQSSGLAVSLSSNAFQYDATTNRLTIDLTADGFGGSLQTVLADGRYDLWLDTSLISTTGESPANQLADLDGVQDGIQRAAFHRLQGDYDGNAQIGQADIDLFMMHYGSLSGQARYDWLFDLTGPAGAADGVINATDFAYLRKRLGRTVS